MSMHSAPYALLPPVEMNLRELDPVEQPPCASACSLSEGLIAAGDLCHMLTKCSSTFDTAHRVSFTDTPMMTITDHVRPRNVRL